MGVARNCLSLRYNLVESWSFALKGSLVRAFNKSNQTFIVGIPSDRIEPSIDYKLALKNKQQISLGTNIKVLEKEAFVGTIKIEINTTVLVLSDKIANNLYVK